MTDQEILDQFNADFQYMRDHKNHGQIEHWRIPTEPNGSVVRDDCDGYATGLLFRLVGRDKEAFWQALKDGTASIHKVWAIFRDGSQGESHAVLRWKGRYVDNIYPEFREDLIHRLNRVYSATDVRMKISRSGVLNKLDSSKKRGMVIMGIAVAVMVGFALLS